MSSPADFGSTGVT